MTTAAIMSATVILYVLATVLRATWPVEAERPKWLVAVLALIDLLQLNFSGPVKLLVKK